MRLTFSKISRDGIDKDVFSTDSFSLEAKETFSEAGQPRRVLSGTAIVCGPLSDDRGGYKVRIAPGAAKFTPTVLALYDHDYARVLGNTANATLKLSLDGAGNIQVDEMILPDTTDGRDVYTLVRDKYVKGMSFGTIPLKWKDYRENGQNVREYTEMLVDEVTVTVVPAFVETNIEVKQEETETTETDVTEATNIAAPEDNGGFAYSEEKAGLDYLRLAIHRMGLSDNE